MIELVDALPRRQRRAGGVRAAARLSARPRARRPRRASWPTEAEAWYAAHGRPWIYAREAATLDARRDGVVGIDGVPFASARLRQTLADAGAARARSSSPSAPGRSSKPRPQRRWRDEKPDEYFFLEVYGSAVVEHLVTQAGARLCAWAEAQGLAVLPHYSPGYPEWDIAEQAAPARAAHGIRGAAAGPARGARLGHAAAEEIAARRVRPDPPRRAAARTCATSCPASTARSRRASTAGRRIAAARRDRRRARSTSRRRSSAAGDDAVAPPLDRDAAYTREREGAAPLGGRAPDADAARRRHRSTRCSATKARPAPTWAARCASTITCSSARAATGYPDPRPSAAGRRADDTGHTHMCRYISDRRRR